MKYNNAVSIAVLTSMLFLFSGTAFSIEDVKLENQSTYVAGTVFTNDTHSEFTLDDCIKIALNNNLTIQSSKLEEGVYKTKIGQTWAKYFPELGAGIDWSRAKTINFIDAYNSSYMPQVSADMLLFDFGKTKADADAAKRTYESKKFDTSENVNVLICNVKKAYYNLLFAQVQCDVYDDTVVDFELQLKQAYALYKAGKKAKVDVAIADYNLCKAKWNQVRAKKTCKIAKLELSRIMGFPEYDNYALTTQMDKSLYNVELEEAIENAYKVRPEFQSAKKHHEAAKMTLRAKRRAFTPDVKINGGFGNVTGTYGYTSYQFGAGLSYNNFNIMKSKKLMDEAKLNYEKSGVDLENLKQDLYLNINRAYSNMQSDGENISIAENALEQAKEQYRQTKGRYKAGIADVIELKDGENAYLNARLDYYNSILNYNVSVAEFEKEIGAPFRDFIKKDTVQ
ncbi:MAG: TolC family protein [bacterium]|nr:TolC family protein [bacterium]